MHNYKHMEVKTMKKFSMILTLVLALSMLAGCAGTTVVYQTNCTCPVGSHNVAVQETPATEAPATEAPVAVEGAVKTGLAVIASIKITDPTAEADGKASYDVTYAAVNVDDNGVITACKFDSVGTDVAFDAAGTIKTEDAEVLTKHELGDNYGMGAFAPAGEWYVQANALADYAVGKTVEELKNGAIDESGYAVDVDLKSSATINLYGYVAAIEAAVNNAKHLGAQAGDELKLVSINALAGGNLNGDVVALTMKDGIITSCYIDSLQAALAIAEDGTVSAGNTLSKNDLGYDYNMVNFQVSTMEWFEQAAGFAAYVTGKTPADVAGIAVDENTYPTDTDLTASCTIAIGGFQGLIAKAAQ